MTLTLEILEKLIAFDTVSHKSNLEMAGFAEDFLNARGFAVTRLPSADGSKMGLYAELGPAGAGVLLSAHMDVVPVDGQNWRRPPFQLTREGDQLFGRGTTDMKAYAAAMLSLADQASRASLSEPLKLVLSYDEEIGCVGIQHMIEPLSSLVGRPKICFVGEPTEMQVATGHKGKAALRARCHGQSGHSALAPNFVNALDLAGEFLVGLRRVQAHYREKGAQDPDYSVPYTTLHAGILQGGTALNIVPDLAKITFEYRHLAADNSAEIEEHILQTAEQACLTIGQGRPEAKIEIENYNSYPGLDTAQESAATLYALQLAQQNHTTKVAFGTEAGFFDRLGIPTIVCGPGSMEGQGHKQDEYLEMRQLVACEEMMARILDDLCNS
ncbi:acetylornithine deacetylase [Roseobacter sp. SK209-2-6]|uniref:acetylornithine deacetylase n=1 Tax=Roseobacter sp. SK209-2-6 TaxID=388739 RepID=UPI0000F3F550|nr:acetylornithine deacetylase [Roseobacter sp. SK209-2-6]EBA14747.1 acetylornithine deacetylase [Roseobacter sp. SK209-2-6]